MRRGPRGRCGGCVYSLARQRRDKCQDTGSRFLGQCQRTDWIGSWWAMLRQPLARPGVLMVASGGLSNRVKAPPLAPSTWSRNPCWAVLNPCWAVLRVSHWHMREVSVAASGGHLFIHPGCLRRFRRYRKTSQSTSAARMIAEPQA